MQKSEGGKRRLGRLLVESGFVDETQLTQVLGRQLSVPWVSLYHVDFSRQLLNLVPREVAEGYGVVPVYVRHVRGQGETLYVATDDPTNEDGLRKASAYAGLPVRPMIASASDIRRSPPPRPRGSRPSVRSKPRGPSPLLLLLRRRPSNPLLRRRPSPSGSSRSRGSRRRRRSTTTTRPRSRPSRSRRPRARSNARSRSRSSTERPSSSRRRVASVARSPRPRRPRTSLRRTISSQRCVPCRRAPRRRRSSARTRAGRRCSPRSSRCS